MTQITIDLPDELIARLKQNNYPIQEIAAKAIEHYIETELTDITRTETWQQCGSLEVTESDSNYTTINHQGKEITNYAENIDQIIY